MTDVPSSDAAGAEPSAPRLKMAAEPAHEFADRSRVPAIEQIAAAGAGHDDQFDAYGWILSAEVAISFLVTHDEVTRRAFGVAVLNLACWCRAVGVAPLELTAAQLLSYLGQLERSCVQSVPTLAQQRQGVLGYVEYACDRRLADSSMLEAVKCFTSTVSTGLPEAPWTRGPALGWP